MNKKLLWFLIIALIIVSIFPLLIDQLIIGNDFPSNTNNSDWMGFFGGYFGAIFGGILSFAGIHYTIRFTRAQNRSDRELQIRPYFDIRFNWTETSMRTNDWLGYVTVVVYDEEEENCACNTTGSGLLYIKNVGNGPATNIDCTVTAKGIKDKHEEYYNTHNSLVTTSSLRPEEEASISIDINNARIAPKGKDITWTATENGPSIALWDRKKFKTPSNFQIILIITYRDLLSNQFRQQLDFETSYYTEYDTKNPSNGAKYSCDIRLTKIYPPEQIQSNDI